MKTYKDYIVETEEYMSGLKVDDILHFEQDASIVNSIVITEELLNEVSAVGAVAKMPPGFRAWFRKWLKRLLGPGAAGAAGYGMGGMGKGAMPNLYQAGYDLADKYSMRDTSNALIEANPNSRHWVISI
jgi:hypothetical protein